MPRPSRRAVAVAVVLVAAAAVPSASSIPKASAATTVVDLPEFAANAIARAKRQSDVPLLLPDRLALPDRPSRFSATAIVLVDPEIVTIDIGFGRNCNGAGACSYASFTAEPGGRRTAKRRVKLRGGVNGYYQPTRCGANCSGPTIQFTLHKVLYTFAAERPERGGLQSMMRLANEALTAGPR